MSSIQSSALIRGHGQNACLPCRSVKMRCHVEASRTICDRCIRKSFDCVFEKHRRGRRPGTKVKRASQAAASVAPERAWSSPDPIDLAATTAKPVEVNDHNAVPGIQANGYAAGGAQASDGRYGSDQSTTFHRYSGLQPSELLSREAKSGQFSLQNVLSIPNLLRSDSDTTPNNEELQRLSVTRAQKPDNPILCGILPCNIALGLFNKFMLCLNPYICQFDPRLHTFDYVQQKSSFLLTAILSSASKAFHPPLHSQLRAHAEKLLGLAFTTGEKSVEVVQAILVLTYWKEPEEARTFLLIGYAIRMCVELEWHALKAVGSKNDTRQFLDETAIREARNVERTWLIIFVYDRSLSSQVGKPWMIELTDLIRGADDWYLHDLALSGGDLLLSAFVRLRILSGEALDLVLSEQTASQLRKGDLLLKLMNAEISRWESAWVPLFDTDGVSPCQKFLVKFYGSHLRLLINSYPLQEALAVSKDGSPLSKHSLWTCFTGAIGMLEQISREFGPLKLLYFAQDSIHVMTAYAVVFLIKLLLSVPSSLRAELETTTLNSILNASRTFQEQCATANTGCALQSKFLSNVVDKYQKMKCQARQKVVEVSSSSYSSSHNHYQHDINHNQQHQHRQQHQQQQHHHHPSTTQLKTNNSQIHPTHHYSHPHPRPSSNTPTPIPTPKPTPTPTHQTHPNQPVPPPTSHTTNPSNTTTQKSPDSTLSNEQRQVGGVDMVGAGDGTGGTRGGGATGGGGGGGGGGGRDGGELLNFVFNDDDLWETVFADAGFSINDGVFMPYDGGGSGGRGCEAR